MNRAEFMERLEELLQDIPAEEREEAVQYYQDYFDDGGPEHEADIIQELESPEKVAALIKEDIEDDDGEGGEYTETGYKDGSDGNAMPAKRGYRYHSTHNWRSTTQSGNGGDRDKGTYQYDADRQYDTGKTARKPRTSRLLKVILIIAIICCVMPVAIPVSIGGIGMVIGIICALIGLFIGLVIGSAAVFISGLAILAVGLMKLSAAASVGIFTIGAGLILIALGMAATVATVKLCLIVYPAMFRGVVNLLRKPLHRKGAV